MKNIAIIGASYLQLPLILKAKELKYTTHVFAWAANDVGEKAADFFYPISITDKEEIADKCKEIGICGVCSIASDLAAVTVNYVADKLGLVGNSMECTGISTNKHYMRQAFEENNDPSPRSILVDDKTDLEGLDLSFPVIVKPLDRSGSRGINKLESPEGLKEAIKSAMAEGFEKKALIEEFAEGNEYSVEGISYRGKHHILAITKKYTTGAPHFIETGHEEPAPLDEALKQKVCEVVVHALDSLKIENSASHTELKIDDNNNIKIIEIGGRMGGDCIGSDLVYYSTGVDFVKAVIDVACGNEPDISPKRDPIPVRVQYIFNKEDLKTYLELKEDHPDMIIKEVYLDTSLLDKATNSSDRAGCYIMKIKEG